MKTIKTILNTLLCNQLTGWLTLFIFQNAIPDIRWRKYRFIVDEKSVNKRMIASILWGFYESAEIRYIEQYLNGNLNVLELGGSIGIVSSHIATKLKAGKLFVSVEANPYLVDIIEANVGRHISKGASLKVLNYAVSYGREQVHLNITNNNTETRVIKEETIEKIGIVVNTKTVGAIVREFNMNEYALVCDIEGSEIEVLLHEDSSLEKCKQLFIELHDTFYCEKPYSVADLKELIQSKHGFMLIKQHGPVCYFSK
ncbi:MAG: FkbM family methyltransferase [Bacteroidota bacterium]